MLVKVNRRETNRRKTRPYGIYTNLLHWMLDRLQERSSLIINYFLYTHIFSVPVSNTPTNLAVCPQEKSGIHFLKHTRCRPESFHRMRFLPTLFIVPPMTQMLWSLMDVSCPYTFCAPLTLAATRSTSWPQSEIFITICLSNALHSYLKIFDPEKGGIIFLRNVRIRL